MVTRPRERAETPLVTEKVGAFAALRLRDFRLLLLGTTLSNAAMWIQQVTLGWLVYDLTGSGAALGSLNLVRSAATLGLSPVAGVAIDRFPRRALMYVANGWLLAISLTLGLALLTGEAALWPLFVFTFLGGVAQAIDMPLRQTVVFALVPRPVAPNAVALIQTGWALMRSLGPGIGGFLLLWFGPGGNFLAQAAAYALIMFTIARIVFPPGGLSGPRQALRRNLGEGLRYIARAPVTRAFMLMGWVLPLFIIPIYVALPPIYAKDIFGGGPEALGLLLSAVGVGGIAGGLVTASLGRQERRGLVQLAALLLTGLSLVGFAFSPNLWVALPLLALSGFFEMVFLTTNQTLLQLSIPDELRGRVTGVVSLTAGLSPLGSFAAGAGSDLVGPRAMTVLLGGIAVAIAVLAFGFSPTIRDYRLSQALADAPAPPPAPRVPGSAARGGEVAP